MVAFVRMLLLVCVYAPAQQHSVLWNLLQLVIYVAPPMRQVARGQVRPPAVNSRTPRVLWKSNPDQFLYFFCYDAWSKSSVPLHLGTFMS